MPIKPTDYIASLEKGLRIIEAFSYEDPRLSISQASKKVGLDRATARRCLLTLHSIGYLDYDGKFFTPTPKVLRLGLSSLAALPLPQIVQPWIDQLSEQIKQSVSVSILDDTEIVYIARAAQRKVMSIGLMPGSRLPAHCTSMGRVLLANLPKEEIHHRLTASDLTPRTPYSLTDPEEIYAILKNVSDVGYAFVDQEVELGLRSLAVPVINNKGFTIAALNVGVAAVQSNPKQVIDEYLQGLLKVQIGLRKILN